MTFQPGLSGNPKGRPVGLRDRAPRRTAARKMAAAAAESGLSPLQVMLFAMRTLWARGDVLGAVNIAAKAAPYCHPRLAAVAVDTTVERDPVELTMAELLAIAAAGVEHEQDPDAIDVPLIEHNQYDGHLLAGVLRATG